MNTFIHSMLNVLTIVLLPVLIAGCAGGGSQVSSADPPATVTTPVVSAPQTANTLSVTESPQPASAPTNPTQTNSSALLHQAAERGGMQAQFELGFSYLRGESGLAKDPVQAFKWMSKAAVQGHPNAQLFMFGFYKEGIGTEKNIPLGIQWLRKAAAEGNQMAIEKLSELDLELQNTIK